MAHEKDPCYESLTPECFRKYPQWAKMVFAYRTMIAICPEQIARQLPRILTRLGIPVPPMTPTPQPPSPPPTPAPGVPPAPGAPSAPGVPPAPPAPAPPAPGVPPAPAPGVPPAPPAPAPPAPGVPPAPAPGVPPVSPPSGGVPPIFISPWEPGPPRRPTPSPPGGVWEKKFDNTWWETVYCGHIGGPYTYFEWTGSAWVMHQDSSDCEWAELWPNTDTTWAEGYRPTKLKLEWLPTGIVSFRLKDTAGNIIASVTSGADYYVLPITWMGNDLEGLYSNYDGVQITDIEFYVE